MKPCPRGTGGMEAPAYTHFHRELLHRLNFLLPIWVPEPFVTETRWCHYKFFHDWQQISLESSSKQLTMKSQGQGSLVGVNGHGHIVGPTLWWFIYLSFNANQTTHFWETAISKFDMEIQGQFHGQSQSSRSCSGTNIVSIHIPFISCQVDSSFLKYTYFYIWLWKSKVKVMARVKGQAQIVGPKTHQFISLSFLINWTTHSWDTAILKVSLKNPRLMSHG